MFHFLESIDVPPAYRHDVTFVTSHKGAALCAVFSHDGMVLTKVSTVYTLIFLKFLLIYIPFIFAFICYRICKKGPL